MTKTDLKQEEPKEKIRTIAFHKDYIEVLYLNTTKKVLYSSINHGIDDILLNKVVIVDSIHNI